MPPTRLPHHSITHHDMQRAAAVSHLQNPSFGLWPQAWVRDGYHFESGPSLYSGMASSGKDGNPLAHVLQMVGEPLELLEYDSWNVLLPEGEFLTKVGAANFEGVLRQVRSVCWPEGH